MNKNQEFYYRIDNNISLGFFNQIIQSAIFLLRTQLIVKNKL
jgi:hypothetical protein